MSDLARECVAGDSLNGGKAGGKVVRSASTASGTCCQWKEVEKEEKKRACQKDVILERKDKTQHHPLHRPNITIAFRIFGFCTGPGRAKPGQKLP